MSHAGRWLGFGHTTIEQGFADELFYPNIGSRAALLPNSAVAFYIASIKHHRFVPGH